MTKFQASKEWFEFHGFKDGAHPFESLAAEDDPNLESYFEQFSYFDAIEKPKTTFLFLPRGAGKSANRIYLTRRCENTLKKLDFHDLPDPDVRLPVTYTDFHRLIDKEKVTLKDHVDGILREAVPRLFEVAVKFEQLKNLSENAQYDLIWFLMKFPERLYSELVQKEIRKIKGIKGIDDENKKKLVSKLIQLPKEFFQKNLPGSGLLFDAFSAFTGIQVEKENIPEIERSPLELLSCLGEIAKELKIKSMYIFVDRIDEYCEIHDAKKAARMIRPIVETIPLLEMPGFVFKFFLPLEYRKELLSNLRSDRLDVYDYTWNDNELEHIFKKRLDVCCDSERLPDESERKSFSRLFQNPSESILEEMLRYADKSPRNLLRLAKRIIDEHTKSDSVEGKVGDTPDGGIGEKISEETYHRALTVFARDQIEWRALRDPCVANLGKLDLSDRKPLETLLEEDLNVQSDSEYLKKWKKENSFESPHFNLTDVIRFLNIPKKEARDIVNELEDSGIITSHYKIIDEGLSTYVHTKKGK